MPDLFRLSDDDFINIGCTKDELKEVQSYNKQLDELNAGNGADQEVRKNLEEKLYLVFLKAADRNPSTWEYRSSRLPNWMRATGNVATVDQFLRVYGNRLSLADKTRLLKRRMVTLKTRVNETVAQNVKNPVENNVPEVTIKATDKSAEIEGIRQLQFQNSGNGCWSVSTQMLLQSRGIKNVSQTDIRSFRPTYMADDIRKLLKANDSFPDDKEKEKKDRMDSLQAENFQIMETDMGNNVMERGDAFLQLAPGSMLKGIQISPYSNEVRRMGINKEEYLNRTINTVRNNILHAIKEDKSPVSFLRGGHYITIVGIDEKNNVKYKDSYNSGKGKPDDTHTVKLDQLLKRVVADVPSPIRMEWASEIKLSKDGNKLYNVPSDYLTVGDDGKVIVPTGASTADNLSNGYQNKTGTYIRRRNKSETPNEMENKEKNLANGGVDINEIIYIPKTLDRDMLMKKAKNRSNEEEKRLQNISKKFYNIEHKKGAPAKSKAELDEEYSKLESQSNKALTNKQQASLKQMNESIDAILAAPADEKVVGNQKYINYINGLCDNNKARKMPTFELKNVFAKAIIASKFQSEGRKFDEKKISDQAEKLVGNSFIKEADMNSKDFMIKVLTSNNREEAVRKVRGSVLTDVYGVETKYQNMYLKEMKTLASNMMPKKGRSREYQNLYDAVQSAASIDLKDPEASKKIAEANRKIVAATDIYTTGKEKIRSSTGGKDRFNNAIDAVSIVSAFAAAADPMEIGSMVNRINAVRRKADSDKKNIIDTKNFGGDRASKRNMEILKQAPAKK